MYRVKGIESILPCLPLNKSSFTIIKPDDSKGHQNTSDSILIHQGYAKEGLQFWPTPEHIEDKNKSKAFPRIIGIGKDGGASYRCNESHSEPTVLAVLQDI